MALYQEKPWDLFDAHEVFELDNVQSGLKVYCLFQMAQNKKCLMLFCGTDSFTDVSNLFKLTGIKQVDTFHYFERECFEVVFDFPEYLDEEFLKIGEEMGYTARELPLMHFCEKRCLADMPNDQEAALLISILEGLKEAMDAYLSQGMNLDFNKCRFVYDAKKKTCSSKRTGYRPRKYDIVEIDHPELMEELMEQEEVDEVWEFDLQATQAALQRSKDQRSQPLYMAAIANPLNQQVLASVPFEPEKDFQFECIDLIIESMMQRGLPKAIVVRHPLAGGALMNLCKRLEIELIPVEHFEVLDDFYDGLIDFFKKKTERC